MLRPSLHPGARLRLWPGSAAGQPLHAIVRPGEGEMIRVRVLGGVFPSDTTALVDYVVKDDACYRVRAEIESTPEGDLLLRPIDPWRRVQQRRDLRVSAHGIAVSVESWESECSDELEAAEVDTKAELLDVSASGLRLRTRADFAADDNVLCQFRLPGEGPLNVKARVVRAQHPAHRESAYRVVALEFRELEERNRAIITRWVFREQIRRHKAEQSD